MNQIRVFIIPVCSSPFPHPPVRSSTASLGLEKSFQPSPCSRTAQKQPLLHAYFLLQIFGEGSFHPFRKSLSVRQGAGIWGRSGEQAGSSWISHFKLEAFKLERSFLADKIKAFPLPDHYLIFEAIVELIVSISLVSSCSRLSLSLCACRRKAQPSQPGQLGEGGELPGRFQRGLGR